MIEMTRVPLDLVPRNVESSGSAMQPAASAARAPEAASRSLDHPTAVESPTAPRGASAPVFADELQNAIQSVRGAMETADRTSVNAMVGNAQPHSAMIALTEADLSFRFMVSARNRLMDAYQEIMRMQL